MEKYKVLAEDGVTIGGITLKKDVEFEVAEATEEVTAALEAATIEKVEAAE